ncbi:hypothetical protein AB0G02_29090, partial [Actinosynnema sp. NPDC023658]|uniref:hypothetical protein n=1 Tax=Actinosynnema sp. NPDC023658 TaxID=3155465 RepID=UPI00340DBEA7
MLEELPERGEKVVACVRTAAALLGWAEKDESGLRFAESAAYNLRQSLDAVVEDTAPPESDLRAILNAWKNYQAVLDSLGGAGDAPLRELHDTLRRVSEKKQQHSFHANRLLGYLRGKAGVDPLPGELSPVGEYEDIRGQANKGLHDRAALAAATALYYRTVAWFVRVFTPPDALVESLRGLAAEPWQGAQQIDRLRVLVSNHHHLRLFFGHLTDPAWLTPLHEAGIAALPEPGMPWPVAGVADGLGRTSPRQVADLLERLLVDCSALPRDQQVQPGFELLRVASLLGHDAHEVVARTAAAFPGNRAVRALSVGVAKKADPHDPLVGRVADVVLNAEPHDRERYYYKTVLDQLVAGLDEDNVASRGRMLAAKVRRAARHERAGWIVLGVARLTADLHEDDRDYLVIVVHYLARLLDRARELGVPTSELRAWIDGTPGEIGGRLVCRVLTGADDVPPEDKIDHVTGRLASSTVTGDDKELIEDVLATEATSDQLTAWVDALGTPSADAPDSGVSPPDDWARVWRWSAVLPADLLTSWQDPIAQVNLRHGPLDLTAFERRTPTVMALWGQSVYVEDDLNTIPVLDAARLVASWRPSEESERRLQSARELARTLQAVVEATPTAWSTAATTVVTTLREPVYVLHYFRALTAKAKDITPDTSSIIDAARMARTERWTPTVLGNDDFDFEPDWHNVDTATVDLVAALAYADAPLTNHLDTVRQWALDLVDLTARPGDDDSFDDHDALTRAINNAHGRGLEAVLSLGHWEFRTTGSIHPDFTALLDDVLNVPAPIGAEYRAILAQRRVVLEVIVRDWLEDNTFALFGDHDLGLETFDLTLKYSGQATPWLYERLRDRLLDAARRQAEHAARWLALATLHAIPGYGADDILDSLRGDVEAISAFAEEIAFLVQGSDAATPQLDAAVDLWRALLDANRTLVPAQALRSSGRWAFVTGLS